MNVSGLEKLMLSVAKPMKANCSQVNKFIRARVVKDWLIGQFLDKEGFYLGRLFTLSINSRFTQL